MPLFEKMNQVTAKVNQGKITTSSDEYKKASNDRTKYYDAMMTANKAVEQSGKNFKCSTKRTDCIHRQIYSTGKLYRVSEIFR